MGSQPILSFQEESVREIPLGLRSHTVPRHLRRWNSAPLLALVTLCLWIMYTFGSGYRSKRIVKPLVGEVEVEMEVHEIKPSAPTVNLVLAATKEQNTEWTKTLNITNLNILPYIADDSNATYHPRQNKGREAMIILTYLHDHYDDLPDISIFTHADDYAWHNDVVMKSSLTWMLNNLDLEEVQRRQYLSLRVDWENACPGWINMSMTLDSPQYSQLKREEPYMADAFRQHFPNDTMPEIMAGPCCSQFGVTREAIHRVSKTDYANYIFYLLNTELADELSGRIWEHWWQYLFLGKATDCPIEYKALCAGFHVCFEHQWEFEDYNVLVRMKGDKEGQRNKVRDKEPLDKHQLDLLSWKIRDLERDMDMRRSLAVENGRSLEKRREIVGDDYYTK